jgi:uncharacterized protein (DUF1501 family)
MPAISAISEVHPIASKPQLARIAGNAAVTAKLAVSAVAYPPRDRGHNRTADTDEPKQPDDRHVIVIGRAAQEEGHRRP